MRGKNNMCLAFFHRYILGCSVAALGFFTLGCSPVKTQKTNISPNVVIILADDLGWHDPGCYGNSHHATPNVDKLASEGIRFTHAYAPAPICSAPQSSLLKDNYKIIYFYEDHRVELYDLATDPSETVDISQEFPEKATELTNILKNNLKSMHARIPTPSTL